MEALRDEVKEITLVNPREIENIKPLEEIALVSIHLDYLNRHVVIGTKLTKELRSSLMEFFKMNYDVLTWSQGDVPGIDPQVATHKLFTKPNHPPVHQNRRKFALESLKIIEEDMAKLIKANVIRESHHPDLARQRCRCPEERWKMESMC